MGFSAKMSCRTLKKNEMFIFMLKDIIECARHEIDGIDAGRFSEWKINQLKKVVVPEMNELLTYALKGEVYFKYGKRQRLLESTYLMTDSLEKLHDTTLGKKISQIQRLYNSL